VNCHLAANGFAIECGAFLEHVEGHSRGTSRAAAVLGFFEEMDDFRAALFVPGFGVAHGLAVREG